MHRPSSTQFAANMHAPDLTMVEEMDSQVALDLVPAPATPTRIDLDDQTLFRSPGAASQMSGTTAHSSLSLIEADILEPKFIVRHMGKLCEAADEFLDHVAPDNGTIEVDLHNIREMQKPDSDFVEEYRDFEITLHVHLKHFKGEERSYIHNRAVHQALFGPNGDAVAAQTGLDLILYTTNVLVFAKQMIYSDRSTREVWDALRQMDNSFPSQFMHSLISGAQPTSAGESALVTDTFDLALELRTQLAILVLQRAAQESQFDPEEVLNEVFMLQDAGVSVLRGWNASALGGEDSALPQDFQDRVTKQLDAVRAFFAPNAKSLENGQLIDLEGLSSNFPWEAAVLRLLDWARHRHIELRKTIEQVGDAKKILKRVTTAMENLQSSIENTNAAPALRQSPRKKRTSFGRDRRRSSRRFDPNAPVDARAIEALKARENETGVIFEIEAVRSAQEVEPTQPATEEGLIAQPVPDDQQDDWQPILGDDLEQPEATLVGDPTLVEEAEQDVSKTIPPGPPSSTADMVKMLKAPSRAEKENRSFFDRQPTAVSVAFGEGFDDSQPTPGPSNKTKGKARAEAAPSRKRGRDDNDDDDEDDAFGKDVRTASDQQVNERRRQAPVAKKVRLNSSLEAPPSHQPLRSTASQMEEPEQDESTSEKEAPEMSEDAPNGVMEAPSETRNTPPISSHQEVRQLAAENSLYQRRRQERQPRRQWSAAAEEALVGYMERFPQGYADILKADLAESKILQEWSQVNLKDKVRNMAVTMIK